MKDKLKKIVEKMMEGGFNPYAMNDTAINRFEIYSDAVDFYCLSEQEEEVPETYSFSDLITHGKAMTPLFGEGSECFRPTDGCEVPKHREAECEKSCHHYMPAIVYHGLKAAELLLTQGQQQSIEYIWKECGE